MADPSLPSSLASALGLGRAASAAQSRPVATTSLAGIVGGPVVAWAALQFAGVQLTEDCAAQVSLLLLYGATAAGGVVSGLASWLLRRARRADA